MSEALNIDVPSWVDRAKNDPVAFLQRQAAEITLNAIAMTSPLNEQLVLKGGILMGLAYGATVKCGVQAFFMRRPDPGLMA